MEMHANNQIEGGASSQVAAAAEISLVKQTTVVGELPRDSTDKNEIVEKVITANNDKTTAINNNNGNNKLKQTQQQQQHHQFRTPQQFIKHKKTTNSNNTNNSSGGGSYVSVTLTNNNNKKGKTWNKRQHKNNAKQFQQQQQNNQLQQQQLPTSQSETSIGQNNVTNNNNNNNNNNNSGNICNLLAGQTTAGSLASSTKADLENSQNLKNQLTAANINNNSNNNSSSSTNNNTSNNNNNNNNHHNNNSNNNHSGHHYHYHHHKNHYGIVGGSGNGSGVASNINSEGRSVGNGLVSTPNLTNTTEKLTYGHGHMKQLHKKILAHRGHHHHVLCAAHNNNANVNGGVGSGGTNCCLATNQSAKEVKDPTLITNLLTKCATNVRHFCCARAKFFLPEKRPRKEIIIPPTKFLLGGNISDPLNLNSLQNEASSNNNTPATTPRRSPITTPPKVEVIIPPNIHDPLHLLDPVDSMEYEKQLTSPMKRGSVGGLRGGLLHNMLPHFNKHRQRKHRKPKRRRHESHNSSSVSTANTVSVSDETCSLNNSNTSTKLENVSNRQQLGDVSTTADYSMEERKENITDVLSGEVEHVERHKATLVLSPHNNETDIVTAAIKITTTIVATRSLNSSRDEQSTQSMQQQHVAGDMLPVVEQRVNRSDLRLDLTSTTNSTASSTCGSLNNSRNGCRKRKISESNNSQKNKKFFRMDSMDKIVSPVVPQPGARKRVTLLATGARKPNKRSMSVSESEILSPAEELVKPLLEESLRHSETPVEKLDNDLVIPGSPSSGASVENDSAVVLSDMKVPTTEAEKISTDVPNATSQAVLLANPASLIKLPKFPTDGPKYRYGNYDRYSGFRNLNGFIDVRLQVFQRHVELFQGKDILDIGCNVGHMTITVARNLAPKSIKGIDIDLALVSQARRNLSLYVRIPSIKKSVTFKEEDRSETTAAVVNKMKGKKIRRKNRGGQNINKLQQQTSSHQQQQQLYNYGWPSVQQQHNRHRQRQQELRVPTNEFFPMSFPLTFGGIPASNALLTATNSITTTTTTNISINNKKTTPTTNENTTTATSSTTTTIVHQKKTKNDFPRNVYFQQSNYVLKDEALLANDTQQYDLILCLSVTKWIHLNFGDAGLKLAFKRMFNQLRPGGKLILEAQNWASYKKKKNLTEEIYNNYKNIEFFPNKFHEYLLSSEVGFSHSYTLGVPRHMNKGFCRPIQLYAKGDYTPNHVRWSDAHYPQTPFEAYRGIYATMPPRPVGMAYPICSSRSQNYDTPHHTGASSGPYSCRQTPMHQPTSQYYNPLETDSYQPSYDMEYLNHMYVFASPLYQTVWSPPASLRKSSSHTPLFGSVRDAEFDGECSGGGNGSGGHYPRHVYPPNEDTSSPNANMGGAFNSIHEVDTDDSNQPPSGGVRHVYATTHCGESSSSPQVNHHDVECIVSDEDVATTTGKYCDLSEP